MKKISALLVLCSLGMVSLFAQVTPGPVDIPQAQTEVSKLTQRNSEMDAENETLQSEIDVYESEITEMESLKREIVIALMNVKTQSGDLYTLFNETTDAEMKLKVNNQIVTNRKQKYALDKKMKSLNKLVQLNQESIDRNSRYISVNNNSIFKNKKRIEFLNASIQYTQTAGQTMDAAIQASVDYQTTVDSLISQNPAKSQQGATAQQ